MFKNLSTGAIGIRTNLDGSISLAKKHGFEGVDFSVGEVARLVGERGLEAVDALFTKSGVRPGCFGLPVDWRGDEAKWKEGVALLERQAEIAAALGCRRCATWVPPVSDRLEFAQNFEFHVSRFRPIALALKQAGCRLGLEFIGPATSRRGKGHEFIWTMDGMLDLCRAIGTGNVGLLLDAWHWYTSHGTLDDLKRLRNEDVVTVHLNDAPAGIAVDDQIDNVRCLPAETGVIDLAGFLRALQSMGYDGPVTVEPFSARVRAMEPDDAAAATKASLDKAWALAGL